MFINLKYEFTSETPPKCFLLFQVSKQPPWGAHNPPLNPVANVCNLVKKLETCQSGNFALHPQARAWDGRRFLRKGLFLGNNSQVLRAERELRRLN